VPKHPFDLSKFGDFQKNVKDMLDFLRDYLGNEGVLTVSAYPRLGTDDEYYFEHKNKFASRKIENEVFIKQTYNDSEENEELDLNSNPYSNSVYTKDISITKHPRFYALTRNIRKRKGKKVDIRVPIYKDVNTNLSVPTEDEPYPGYIHMDSMVFGMGNCCIQATVGTPSLNGALYSYDQLLPITPILLALTSSSPIFKGKLSGLDNRFNVLEQSTDDRTEEENNPLSDKYIYKPRYSPAYSYISENIYSQDFHNDYPKFPINYEYLDTFIKHGVPLKLAEHFCNLLVRDPLVVYKDKIDLDKNDWTNLEVINSTNWNSLRLKPPRDTDNDSCFKIEIRPCELQLSPFENLAILELIILLYQCILKYDINFIIPITKVDENFKRAYKMDSILKEKFFWRTNGMTNDFKGGNLAENGFLKPDNKNIPSSIFSKEEDTSSVKELTVQEILLGSEEYNYPGILKICSHAIDKMYENEEEIKKMKINIEFLAQRAKGIAN